MYNPTQDLKKNRMYQLLCCSILTLLVSFPVFALTNDHQHEQEEHHADNVVVLSDELAQSMGVRTQIVQAGRLQITANVYGDIATDSASLSHIRARFDGMVTNVNAKLGDPVKKGQQLAVIESNESLKSYPVTAPFSGIVIARHANEGELSNGQVLFSVASYDEVWARLKIFPSQLDSIAKLQPVKLQLAETRLDSIIHHILPSPDEQPYVLAYAKIDNSSGRWPVGAAIKGQITTSQLNVAMLVSKTAIQEYQGVAVVFVKKRSNEYHLRPVVLGQQDTKHVEILSGLNITDVVVSENSYLFKADLEKSEAGHAH